MGVTFSTLGALDVAFDGEPYCQGQNSGNSSAMDTAFDGRPFVNNTVSSTSNTQNLSYTASTSYTTTKNISPSAILYSLSSVASIITGSVHLVSKSFTQATAYTLGNFNIGKVLNYSQSTIDSIGKAISLTKNYTQSMAFSINDLHFLVLSYTQNTVYSFLVAHPVILSYLQSSSYILTKIPNKVISIAMTTVLATQNRLAFIRQFNYSSSTVYSTVKNITKSLTYVGSTVFKVIKSISVTKLYNSALMFGNSMSRLADIVTIDPKFYLLGKAKVTQMIGSASKKLESVVSKIKEITG